MCVFVCVCVAYEGQKGGHGLAVIFCFFGLLQESSEAPNVGATGSTGFSRHPVVFLIEAVNCHVYWVVYT